jgi:hypothetical protein
VLSGEQGNTSGAKSTLDYAMDYGITLGPEATKAYLMLSANMKASSGNRGIFSTFTDFFSTKKDK